MSCLTYVERKKAWRRKEKSFANRSTHTHNLQSAHAKHTSAKKTILRLLGTLHEAQSARDEETCEKVTVKQALSKADTEVAKLRDQIDSAEMEMQDIRGELAVNQVALVVEQTITSILRSEMTAARGEFSMLKTELETPRKNLIDARVEGEQDL